MLTLLDEKDWPEEIVTILDDVYDIRTDTDFFIEKADYGYVVLDAFPEPLYICECKNTSWGTAVFLDLGADSTPCLGLYSTDSALESGDLLFPAWGTYTSADVIRTVERIVGSDRPVDYGSLMGSIINTIETMCTVSFMDRSRSCTLLEGLLRYMKIFGLYPWTPEDATPPALRKKYIKPKTIWLN